MPPRVKPGLAFWIVCDLGFAVGIVTHKTPRQGTLIWIAEPIFDEEPTVDQVVQIHQWRWPIFFPLGTFLHRKAAILIGVIALPPELEEFPVLRSRHFGGRGGWDLVKFVDGSSRTNGICTDPTIPVYQLVNDIALKEMIVSGYRPEQVWVRRPWS